MQWEYKTVRFETSGGAFAASLRFDPDEMDRRLASAGADGWELVDTATLMDRGWTRWCILIFKRPLPEQ